MQLLKKLLAKLWKVLNLLKKLQLAIMRFIQQQFLIGVTGVIINEKNQVLLFKHTYRQQEWSLPGGYLHVAEHPGVGLAREIFEESGFRVVVIEQLKTAADPDEARLDIACLGRFEGGTFTPSEEVSEYQFCDFSELPPLARSQKKLIKQAYELEHW